MRGQPVFVCLSVVGAHQHAGTAAWSALPIRKRLPAKSKLLAHFTLGRLDHDQLNDLVHVLLHDVPALQSQSKQVSEQRLAGAARAACGQRVSTGDRKTHFTP